MALFFNVILLLSLFITLSFELEITPCKYSDQCEFPCSHFKKNGVTRLCVSGDHYSMGQQYGSVLKDELKTSLTIFKEYYQKQGVDYNKVIEKAKLFQQRYSHTFTKFLEGISSITELSMNDVEVLNGMETIGNIRTHGKTSAGACLFANIPGKLTATKKSLIARFYDYPQPFHEISQNLVVTEMLIDKVNGFTNTIIGMPGQIYCPSCVNSEGLLLELNNGMFSGGSQVVNRTSMLINMQEFLENSKTFSQLTEQLNSAQSDYSLIVNAASADSVLSFEFSSELGMKKFQPAADKQFVSTNYYQNTTWKGIPKPSDIGTSLGVTRLNHMMHMLEKFEGNISVQDLKTILDVPLLAGGSKWWNTIYQFIFDPQSRQLSIRSIYNGTWTEIQLTH